MNFNTVGTEVHTELGGRFRHRGEVLSAYRVTGTGQDRYAMGHLYPLHVLYFIGGTCLAVYSQNVDKDRYPTIRAAEVPSTVEGDISDPRSPNVNLFRIALACGLNVPDFLRLINAHRLH